MTIATLTKKTFNYGGSLTVSEVQSIIIMMGPWQGAGGCSGEVPAGNRKPTVSNTEEGLSKRDLKACPYSDTFPPIRSHLLRVPLLLGAFFFFKSPQCPRLSQKP